ncbi:MAG: hypothetical protein IPP80_13850 [Ignavibacteria bacterium]|nr:hypothetical protein [Ignavibacteria bacterium]
MDLIGVDVNLDVTKSQWGTVLPVEPRFNPITSQQQYVDAGLRGKEILSLVSGYQLPPSSQLSSVPVCQ